MNLFFIGSVSNLGLKVNGLKMHYYQFGALFLVFDFLSNNFSTNNHSLENNHSSTNYANMGMKTKDSSNGAQNSD
jgi:hypothetical protein